MSMTYMQAIGIGFPKVQCYANGDGSVYENIVWVKGDPLPSKATLDAWIAANASSFLTGPEGFHIASSEIESSTTSTSYQRKMRLTTIPLAEDITYRVGWYCELRGSSTSVAVLSRIQLNNQQVSQIRMVPRNTSDYYPFSGFYYFTPATTNIHEIDIDWSVSGSATGYIRAARIEITPIR